MFVSTFYSGGLYMPRSQGCTRVDICPRKVDNRDRPRTERAAHKGDAMNGSKQVKRILAYVEQNGWTVKATAKGFMLRCPCGHAQVLIHKTSSDHRALQNIRQDLRKAGLDMPTSVAA